MLVLLSKGYLAQTTANFRLDRFIHGTPRFEFCECQTTMKVAIVFDSVKARPSGYGLSCVKGWRSTIPRPSRTTIH